MKMLEQIIESVADKEQSLPDILRRCMIIAYKLKNDSLKSWVEKELNGYEDGDPLPDYRQAAGVAKGLFIGGFGSSIRDQPLSPHVLAKEHKHFATDIKLTQPVAAYENVTSETNASIEWPAQLVVIYQSKFMQGMALNRAYMPIPASMMIALLDTVKTRILKFALELQEQLPNEDEKAVEAIPPATVEKIVQITIYGGNNVFGDVQTIDARSVTIGDFESLSSALEAVGIKPQEITELKNKIDEDKASPERDKPVDGIGQKTSSWIAETAKKLGGGAVKVGGAVAEEVIKAYIKGYLGVT